MNEKYKYLLKNTTVLTIGQFASKILVFLLVPLYTSVLSTEEYGSYDLVVTTVQLLLPILTLNVYEGIMRYLMDDKIPQEQSISIGLKYVIIGIVFFSVFVLTNGIFNWWEFLSEYSILVILYFSLSLINQYLVQVVKGVEKVKVLAISGVIGTLATIILNIGFLLVLKKGIEGYFLASILGMLLQTAYMMINVNLPKYLTKKIDKRIQKEICHYSFPLIFNTLGWWANSAADRYIVTWFCGVGLNGIYSISYKIPSILNIFQNIFTQAWQISAIKEYGNDNSNIFYGKALYYINFMMSFTCMWIIFFTIPIAKFLYAKDFFSAWQYVPFLLLSSVINAASGVLGPILSANKNTKAMGKSAIIGAFSNVILNLLLVKLIGVQGAAIATAISSWIIYECRKKAVGIDINLYKYNKIIFTWILIIIQAVFIIYTRIFAVQIIVILIFCMVYCNDFRIFIKLGMNIIKKK